MEFQESPLLVTPLSVPVPVPAPSLLSNFLPSTIPPVTKPPTTKVSPQKGPKVGGLPPTSAPGRVMPHSLPLPLPPPPPPLGSNNFFDSPEHDSELDINVNIVSDTDSEYPVNKRSGENDFGSDFTDDDAEMLME